MLPVIYRSCLNIRFQLIPSFTLDLLNITLIVYMSKLTKWLTKMHVYVRCQQPLRFNPTLLHSFPTTFFFPVSNYQVHTRSLVQKMCNPFWIQNRTHLYCIAWDQSEWIVFETITVFLNSHHWGSSLNNFRYINQISTLRHLLYDRFVYFLQSDNY